MEIQYKFNLRALWFAIAGFTLLLLSYLIYAFDPLTLAIKFVFVLKPGSIFFNLWSNPPYEVLIKVSIFNVTNHQQFLSGEDWTLNFTEIGPYVYREILTNENATFRDDGTVTFYPKRRIEFVPQRSIGDPKLDTVITPNIPLIGMQAYFNDAPFYTNFGFSSVTKLAGSKSFLNLTVDQYLWGYEDRIVQMANEYLPSWIDFDTFGILDRLLTIDNNNVVTIAAVPEKYTEKNSLLTDVESASTFHIVDWNGSPGLKEWGWKDSTDGEIDPENKRCQLVAGSFEGTILPTDIPENLTVKMFRKAFCRPVPLDLDGLDKDENGFNAYKFIISDSFLETPDVNPDNACFCLNGKCPPRGLAYLSPCYYGMPITMSRPHFLQADPEIYQRYTGIKPNPEIHNSFAKVHDVLGLPLEGHLRVQINLDVGETKYNYLTEPFNHLHLPLFWLELTTGDFPSLVYHSINWTCHILPVIQTVIMYIFALIGLSLVSISALLTLFYTTTTKINNRLSLKTEYSSLPTIITIPSQYFKSELNKLGK